MLKWLEKKRATMKTTGKTPQSLHRENSVGVETLAFTENGHGKRPRMILHAITDDSQ